MRYGAKIGEGREVMVYAHDTHPGLVVKIPQPHGDPEKSLHEHLNGLRILLRANLEQHVLPTTIVPCQVDGRLYPFAALQKRVNSTVFDDIFAALTQQQLDPAVHAIQRF